MFLAFVAVCALQQIFLAQADLDLTIEFVEIEEISPEYFEVDECEFLLNEESDGRNTISTKVVIKKDMPEDLMGHICMYGYSMGEYKIDVGMDISGAMCEMLDDPMVVGPIMEVMGFTKDECPPEPGTYEKDGYYPVMDFLPESFPSGKYQLVFELRSPDEVFMKVSAYLVIN